MKSPCTFETAPKIKLSPVTDSRPPYPLTQEEQSLLFQELPDHLARMALYKVHGLPRGRGLSFALDYEVKVPELDTFVFVIPKDQVKNGEERLVVLNWSSQDLVDTPF